MVEFGVKWQENFFYWKIIWAVVTLRIMIRFRRKIAQAKHQLFRVYEIGKSKNNTRSHMSDKMKMKVVEFCYVTMSTCLLITNEKRESRKCLHDRNALHNFKKHYNKFRRLKTGSQCNRNWLMISTLPRCEQTNRWSKKTSFHSQIVIVRIN